jgi:4a-hydroxytetrahydrobiopterin dehydratase
MNALLFATHHCNPNVQKLTEQEMKPYLSAFASWTHEGNFLSKSYSFPDHYQLMAFVNALAWISHRTNHHADVQYAYNHCTVRYTTHDVGGLTENDFICAAKVDILLAI